jgi:hypothetical protein
VVPNETAPYTAVAVNGTEYRLADLGGYGLDEVGVLDLYVPGSHQDALKAGRLRGADIVIVSLPEVMV